MPSLHLTCFQSFTAALAGAPAAFRSAKGRALLIYLAVEQDRPHQRATLAGLLWPDESEARARKNLSQTLLEVRKAIGDADAAPPFLLTTPQSIAFNPQSLHQLDVADFVNALQSGNYAQAAALYAGPFLDDFYVADSDLLEDWMVTTRERLHQQMLTALSKLTEQQETQGKWDNALASVRRLLALAPWQEEAHCQLMRLLARSGQRSAALAQYDTLTQMLMDELGVSPAPETDALYDQILAGGIGPLSSGASGSVASAMAIAPAEPPFQALAQPSHFVGRRAEIERLRTQMSAPGLHIHAIVGMGGVGKTTLTTQVAHAARNAFRDGVLWANPLTSNPLDILASWANAYGYDFSQISELGSRAAAVRGLLAQRQTLIVIDNVRQVSDIEPLLPNGGDCAVLFTTRDLEVAAALNAETLLLDELDESEALELLRAILGNDRVNSELAAAVEICTLCGDLPLAVEIAAQRLKSRPRMKLGQMVERLGHQQQRLALEISDRAVRSSFEVSWAALDEELQAVFPLLAVFEGRSFTSEAVASLSDLEQFDVEDYLFALSALSLVREEAENRWWQHPLMADFALEKLGANRQVFERMARYYYQFAEKHRTNYVELEAEWGNVMSAIEVAHRLPQRQLLIDFSMVLAAAWLARARYAEARRAFGWAQDAARFLGDAMAQAQLLVPWGEICIEQNDYQEAEEHLQTSFALFHKEGNRAGCADAHYHLARVAIEQNRYAQAGEYLQQCLAIREELGEPRALAQVYYRQARLHYDYGPNFAAAKQMATQALTIQQTVNDTLGMILTLRTLAQIASKQGDYELAKQHGEEARRRSEALQDRTELAASLYVLSHAYLSLDDKATAQEMAERSLELFSAVGNRRAEGLLLTQLTTIYIATENFERADQSSTRSIALLQQIGDNLGLAHSLQYRGDLDLRLGRVDDSLKSWRAAIQIAQRMGHHDLLHSLEKRMQQIVD